MAIILMNCIGLYLTISVFLLRIPNSYSEESAMAEQIKEMLEALPEPYNEVPIEKVYDAQIGDECTLEAWKKLTEPFWEQNFNEAKSAQEEIFNKAHTGWIDNPEYAGKSCFNNRHVRQGSRTFPALALKCVSGRCTCYKNVLGSKTFYLHQIEVMFKPKNGTTDEVIDCLGDIGSNCNQVLFPCAEKHTCEISANGRFQCKSNKSETNEIVKQGRKPVVKKELRTDKNVVKKVDIPGLNNGGLSSVVPQIGMLFSGILMFYYM